MPRTTVSRVVLLTGAVVAVTLVLVAIRSWDLMLYRIEYLCEKAIELPKP